MFPVLLLKASAPASVANVPVVGKVTPVAAVIVNVVANAPLVVRFPPSVIVPVLLTPVPPRAAAKVPAAIAAASSVPPPAAFWWVWFALTKLAMVGVTIVGELPNTNAPVPVSSVIAAARLALDGVPSHVATPDPRPVRLAKGKPVQFVKTPLVGVPSNGAMRVGVFAKTAAPVPVSSERTPASCAEVVAANWLSGLAVRPTPAGRSASRSAEVVGRPEA